MDNIKIADGFATVDAGMTSFLMIGQSNMAGRGDFGVVPPIENDRCFMLRMGRWQKMSEPINPDRGIFDGPYRSGVGLAASFADEYAKYFQKNIGLIPCADGGTGIDQWQPGEVLFDHAVMMTKLALRTSKLGGILWHQGEHDCRNDDLVKAYKEKFLVMITALRKELGAEQLPVILGELSTGPAPEGRLFERRTALNGIFAELAEEVPLCAVASAAGFRLRVDNIHFDSPSYREFGKRYFRKYLDLAEKR